MPALTELNERFQADRFAVQLTGAEILEAEPGRAVCRLRLRPDHMNANFAFAVAANGGSERVTVSQHVSITFLSPAKGSELLAEASCRKAGRTTCLYQVEVRDELGTYVAHAEVNGFTVG